MQIIPSVSTFGKIQFRYLKPGYTYFVTSLNSNKMNVLIAGGSGFLGRNLARHLTNAGHMVSFLSRKKLANGLYYYWEPENNEIDPAALVNKDVIINLSGAGIAKQLWTKRYKGTITDSRILSTRLLVNSLIKLEKPPQLFINSSAIGYYGNQAGIALDEKSQAGSDFLAATCLAWESEVQRLDEGNIPYAILRIGIVFGPGGGSLSKLQLPMKYGLNAVFGKGRQFISWIHISDFSQIVEHLIQKKLPADIYNVVSPNPVSQQNFNKAILQNLGRKAIKISIPSRLMHFSLGEMASLFTNDQRVIPTKLMENKYAFKFPDIDEALKDVK